MNFLAEFFSEKIDLHLFGTTFVLIFFAELPDKTAFATLLLATRAKPLLVFIGVGAAFFIQCVVAVLFGEVLTLLPHSWIHLAASILFFIFAVVVLRRKDEPSDEEISGATGKKVKDIQVIWNSFLVIFVSEWGDLTQLASASLVAQYHKPLTILLASTLSLWLVTAIAAYVGSRLKRAIHPRVLNRIAAGAFVLVGCYMLFSWARDVGFLKI